MKYRYDLHIHSALSPCAENDMTPVTIVGQAKLMGLDFVAIADHNAIENVEVAICAGEAYGILVVPSMEVQTKEDIHILCMFRDFESLKGFYDSIEFSKRQNRREIFGEQLVFDEDDNVIREETTMLLDSADISSDDVLSLATKFFGVAVPAHIDREMNGMLQILGTITEGFRTVEFSAQATEAEKEKWSKTHKIIIDSDAHVLDNISLKGEIQLEEYSIDCLLSNLT